MSSLMTPDSIVGHAKRRQRPAAWLGWLLPVGFGILAVTILAASRTPDIPLSPPQLIDRASLAVGPRRVAMTDPAHILVEGVPQNCNGCHQIFQSSHPAGAIPSYHQDIRLYHGLNNRCVNCHDSADRQRLTLRDGATVSFADTPQLCAQCHGTAFRDWQRGTHGKTLGSWVTHSEAQHRLSCNECHNPHAPRYEPYTPLPGPNTLRMGDQSKPPDQGHAGKQSPLQRSRNDPNAAHPNHKPKVGEHP